MQLLSFQLQQHDFQSLTFMFKLQFQNWLKEVMKNTFIVFSTLVFIVMTQQQYFLQFPAPRHINYTSIVYCPLDQTNTLQKFYQKFTFKVFPKRATNTAKNHRKLTLEQETDIQKYLIVIQWSAEKIQLNHFVFCSYTRYWLQKDCSNAKIRCSSPGPMFYVKKNNPIQVAWIYDIKGPQYLPNNYKFLKGCCYFLRLNDSDYNNNQLTYCHGESYINIRCNNNYKIQHNQKCTYSDPINMLGAPHLMFRNNMTSVPVTMHIHGLEVRPTFDGNPENQMAGYGHFGIGYQTLANHEYYKQFTDYKPASFHFTAQESQFLKIDRYQNFQDPGTLYYHDHSNHVTYVNNVLGLFGLYIIYDEQIEKDLPSQQNRLFIISTPTFVTDDGQTYQNNNIFSYHNVDIFDNRSLILRRNQTYRFTILNGVYESSSSHISFFTQCNINIQSTLYDFRTCKKQLNFSVIATDSLLFDQPVHNVNNFSLFSAQRIDILIIFDGNNGQHQQNYIKPSEHNIWMVTQGNYTKAFVHKLFQLEPKVHLQNQNLMPQQFQKINGMQFYDLRQITQTCKYGFDQIPQTSSTCIYKTRYKGLMRDTLPNFAFNGHYEYMNNGTADYVQIGTTQDWYFINLLNQLDEPHSLHIHLVNSQIIQRGEVKKIPGQIEDPSNDNQFPAECSYYQVDFFLNGKAIPNDTNDYLIQCQMIRQMSFIELDIGDYYKQNVFDENNSTGFPLLTLMSEQEFKNKKYYSDSCPESRYKYICNSSLQISPYLRKWKDTVPLIFKQFVRIRLRFTSHDYNPQKSAYPFFNVPEDQILQFPNYVYHCHYLRHEDLSQMRPLIFTPSPFFAQHFPPPAGSKLQKCMSANNLENKRGWQARYNCLNKIVGCFNQTQLQPMNGLLSQNEIMKNLMQQK